MSGGSHDYICYQIDEHLVGQMHDDEMNEMVEDFANLCHDLEWWDSNDYAETDYRETLAAFKKKWFGNTEERAERLKRLIDEKTEQTRRELYEMIGVKMEDEEDDGK